MGTIWLIAGALTALCFTTVLPTPQEMQEYCPDETFRASCQPNEVVVILAANYGRMRLGRCVKKDLGYVGCHIDALEVTDILCSGRHECSFRIPDLDVHMPRSRNDACLEELIWYLEASYMCLPVETAPLGHRCPGSDSIKARDTSGYLASIISQETNCGTGGTPWIIEAQPGQRLNLSLIDFNVYSNKVASEHAGSLGICHAYAIVREAESRSEPITVCGGIQREKSVFLSKGNKVEVRIFARRESANPINFLLKYTAVGCADLQLGPGYKFSRQGDKVVVTCTPSNKAWALTCVGSVWLGRVGNCSYTGVI